MNIFFIIVFSILILYISLILFIINFKVKGMSIELNYNNGENSIIINIGKNFGENSQLFLISIMKCWYTNQSITDNKLLFSI